MILFVDIWPASGPDRQVPLLLLLEDPKINSCLLWVARVPSKSNVADHPSRGSLKETFVSRTIFMCGTKMRCGPRSLSSLLAEADLGDKAKEAI